MRFSIARAVTVAAPTPEPTPTLVNGLSFADDVANDTHTLITLGEPSVAGNTFVYVTSAMPGAFPTPVLGTVLIGTVGWRTIQNSDSIAMGKGRHVGVAEVDGLNRAVQFSDALAVVTSGAKAITASAVGTLFGGNITAVPAGTKVSPLNAGLTVSANATLEILDGTGGDVVTDQANTNITATVVIKVTAEDLTTAEYTIAME